MSDPYSSGIYDPVTGQYLVGGSYPAANAEYVANAAYEGGSFPSNPPIVAAPVPVVPAPVNYLEQGRQTAANESYIPPSGNIGAAPTSQTMGLGTGQTDFATPLVPVYAPTGYTPPPVAPVGAPLVSPEAAAIGGPVAAPQYQAGVAPNSGGYANSAYSGGSGMAPAPMGNPMMGGMMLPNGEPFGAPKQMAPDGSFDPFLWSGTANPMPPPSTTRAMILQEMGLLNPLTQAPPGPTMQYVAAKLGLELPNAMPTGASLANAARPVEPGAPAPVPAAPAPPSRGNYPPLPPMPLPNRGY